MKWMLVLTAIINGAPYHMKPVFFPTQETCLKTLRIVEQHPMFKQYSAKASCEQK